MRPCVLLQNQAIIISRAMPVWYYEKKDLKNSPSTLSGLPYEDEIRYRREGAR
jgi:hypothetical protein